MASQHNMAVWRDCIHAWYPDYETKTYFVPPVVITRIPLDVETVAGQPVFVPQCNPAQDCHMRDDLALQRVLHNLRELVSEQSEPMFVISQLQFSNYLGNSRYAENIKMFTRPKNLSKDYKQGDFDILIIHRHYGIITGEIKSVLSNQQELQLSQPDVDRVVTDRVRKAIKQLNKSQVVLREITKDLDSNLAIRKVLILPYVTADVLMRVVTNDEKLKQDLVTCLQAVDFEQALQRCLLAEDFSSSVSETISDQQPQTWWSTFTAVKSENNMTANLYLDLLARFCGPATTVSVYWLKPPRIEVRTEGQGVAVTGERMTSLVLTPEQISLLTRAPTKVFLTGPPGVGKSVMLVLMALTWLRQGHDVNLVSIKIDSLAATRMINHVIQVSMHNDPTTPSVVGSVHLHEYDFYSEKTDVDKVINQLTATRGRHGPHFICDEFWIDFRLVTRYHQFVTDLCTHLPNVSLWAASLYHHQRPAELQEERMTTPLRCPQAVVSEVQKALNSYSYHVHPYTMTAPCDGPNIIHLIHQEPEHAELWPLECVKCGQSIAGILQRLGVGVTDSGANSNTSTLTMTATTGNKHNSTPAACPPLQNRDVFVLTGSIDLRDDVMDATGCVTSPANGVVRGLRAAGIPVRVIRSGHVSRDVIDTAVSQSDVVTVTNYEDVTGLERKVVVCLPDRNPGFDGVTDEVMEFNDRLYAMSRCTAQLVVVDVPVSDGDRHVAGHLSFSDRKRLLVSRRCHVAS